MKNNSWVKQLFCSWLEIDGNVTENQEIDEWIELLNRTTKVEIIQNKLSESNYWFYDKQEGIITNKNRSFFSIQGIQKIEDGYVVEEQPILIQNEIGFLGVICCEINGVLNFLMQAKIEPGNINKIQVSPTIQATKSNFTQKHGGKKPQYLEYFTGLKEVDVIVDQIQSEQSSRFFHKRNRNMVVLLKNEDIVVKENFKWMTLGQIKRLMKIDNIVNMDTRTVISCMPVFHTLSSQERQEWIEAFEKKDLARSIIETDSLDFAPIFNRVNNIKMFEESSVRLVPLSELTTWDITDEEISKQDANFKVIFCDISIERREVTHWSQPLFKANGIALFGLLTKRIDGKIKFAVSFKREIGCFDRVELGPTVQLEANEFDLKERDSTEQLFFNYLEKNKSIQIDVLLSEEGGRFYHEQNRNIIIELSGDDDISDEYMWVDYFTLNQMIQFNNTCNIQLRNLISLLEV